MANMRKGKNITKENGRKKNRKKERNKNRGRKVKTKELE